MTHPGPAAQQITSRALILDAACAELAERGYESATVRSIARRAGVDPGLIRHYFGGKSELIREALALDALIARVGDRIGAQPGAASLGRRLYRLGARFWAAEPVLWQALVASSTSAEPEVRSAFAALIDSLVGVLSSDSDASAEPGIELRAELAVGALVGLWVTQRVLDLDDRSSRETLERAAVGGLELLLAGA